MKDQKIKNKIIVDQNISRRGFITKTALAAGAISILPRHVFGRGFIVSIDKIIQTNMTFNLSRQFENG